jgi:hypothetical protein
MFNVVIHAAMLEGALIIKQHLSFPSTQHAMSMRWTEHSARIKQERNSLRVLVGNLEEMRLL